LTLFDDRKKLTSSKYCSTRKKNICIQALLIKHNLSVLHFYPVYAQDRSWAARSREINKTKQMTTVMMMYVCDVSRTNSMQ